MKRPRDAAFAEFFDAESDGLRRFGTFLTGDPQEGADLAQEALARTYASWDRIRDGRGAYARRVVVNLVRSAYRRRVVARRHPSEPARPSPSPATAVEDWVVVCAALQKISPIRRAVVVLRIYEDLPEATVAEILDRPVGTVKSDLHRALTQLRTLLEDVAPAANPRRADVSKTRMTDPVQLAVQPSPE